ncbi:MAG TPA: hypothetical protein VF450_21205 [Noviherbaspirillum sp.]
MSNLNEKLAAAKVGYEAARLSLDKARSEYENGPGKAYAAVKQNIAQLKAQLEQYEQGYLAAKQALADAMNESNAAQTPKVKEALNEVRSAEHLVEECSAILRQAEDTASTTQDAASKAAIEYRGAYQSASLAWATMNAYAVLVDCGEKLCAAMAVVPTHDPDTLRATITAAEYELSLPRNVILSEIHSMLNEYEGDTRPYAAEIGKCNLGAMSRNEIVTPAQRHFARTLQVIQPE